MSDLFCSFPHGYENNIFMNIMWFCKQEGGRVPGCKNTVCDGYEE